MVWVPSVSGFWIYHVSKYTRVLNVAEFWIYQDSEYTSGSKYTSVLIMPRFSIWIYQCSEYTKVLNMPGLHRVPNDSEQFLNMSDYAWIGLNMSEYAEIYINMPKSDWLAFVLHFTVVTPCLLSTFTWN